jgi:hypothetical protein
VRRDRRCPIVEVNACGPPGCGRREEVGDGCIGTCTQSSGWWPLAGEVEVHRIVQFKVVARWTVLLFARGYREADGRETEQGANNINLPSRVGGVLDPEKLQLNRPLPFVTQGVCYAWRRPAIGAQILGLGALNCWCGRG